VLCRHWVTTAASLISVSCRRWAVTTKNVPTVRDFFKMLRIDAKWGLATFVI